MFKIEAVDDDDDHNIHRFACAVNYILEIWCSYIWASAKLGADETNI